MNQKKISVIASDMRQIYMERMLKEKGYATRLWNLMEHPLHMAEDSFFASDNFILPVPVSRLGETEEFVKRIAKRAKEQKETTTCYGGVFPKEMKQTLLELQVEVVDVLQESQVAAQNAIATAEGTIAELMTLMPVNVEGSQIVVMGFGKCGKVIAEKLYCLGAEVSVVTRNENAKNLAGFFGFGAYSFNDETVPIKKADAVINTVPALVVDAKVIDRLNRDAVILDIASFPGGCDQSYCQKKQIPYKLALGLPGMYSPKTSAGILLDVMPF